MFGSKFSGRHKPTDTATLAPPIPNRYINMDEKEIRIVMIRALYQLYAHESRIPNQKIAERMDKTKTGLLHYRNVGDILDKLEIGHRDFTTGVIRAYGDNNIKAFTTWASVDDNLASVGLMGHTRSKRESVAEIEE